MYNIISVENIRHKFNRTISKCIFQIQKRENAANGCESSVIWTNRFDVLFVCAFCICRSSRIFFGGTGEYVSRERCRDDYYTLASTPISLSDSCGNSTIVPHHNGSGISTPLSIAVQQHNQMQTSLQQQQQHQHSQMPPTGQQSNVPSVLYTVQRVITTSQIQSTEMLECSPNPATNIHLSTATNTSCSNTYQTQSHQIISQMTAETQANNSNYYAPTSSNTVPNSGITISRPLQNVSFFPVIRPIHFHYNPNLLIWSDVR